MHPVLAGYRLRNGFYEPIQPDDNGHLTSEVLQLQLRVCDEDLRFYDPLAGAYLRTYEEAEARAADAEARATDPETRAAHAAQEVAALKAQLAAMQERKP